MPGQVLQPARVGEEPQLRLRDPRDLARGAAERLLAMPGRAAAHEEVGDALESLDRRHAPKVPRHRAAKAPSYTRRVPEG